ELSPTLRAEAHASHLANRFSAGRSGLGGGADFVGDVNTVGADLHWKGWHRHEWLVAVAGSFETIDRAFFSFPAPPPGSGLSSPPPIEVRDQKRDAVGATLQDQIEVSSRLAVIA